MGSSRRTLGCQVPGLQHVVVSYLQTVAQAAHLEHVVVADDHHLQRSANLAARSVRPALCLQDPPGLES